MSDFVNKPAMTEMVASMIVMPTTYLNFWMCVDLRDVITNTKTSSNNIEPIILYDAADGAICRKLLAFEISSRDSDIPIICNAALKIRASVIIMQMVLPIGSPRLLESI